MIDVNRYSRFNRSIWTEKWERRLRNFSSKFSRINNWCTRFERRRTIPSQLWMKICTVDVRSLITSVVVGITPIKSLQLGFKRLHKAVPALTSSINNDKRALPPWLALLLYKVFTYYVTNRTRISCFAHFFTSCYVNMPFCYEECHLLLKDSSIFVHKVVVRKHATSSYFKHIPLSKVTLFQL